jgi:DNA-binding IclR family transcriptional regulator
MALARKAAAPTAAKVMDTSIIHSLDKGLKILESIIEKDRAVRVIDVAQQFDMDKATAHRYLTTLEKLGLVRQDTRSREYALGAKLLAWAGLARTHFQLTDLARPFLQRLAADTGHEAHLGVLLKESAIIVDTASSNSPVSVRSVIGTLEPLHCTALGKAIVAFLPDAQRDALLDVIPMPALTPKTIVDRKLLREDLRDVRSNRFALDAGEHLAILTCLAAPILNHNGFPLGSVGISMVTALLEGRGSERKRLSALVSAAAQEISRVAAGQRP